jgi:hypothetical protein
VDVGSVGPVAGEGEVGLDGRARPIGVDGEDVGELPGDRESDVVIMGCVGAVIAGGRGY